MKFYRNRINGKEYLYAYDTLYVAKGKTIQKAKSMGLIDSISDLSRKKKDFFDELIAEETKKRAEYWKLRTRNPNFGKYVSVDAIEHLRTKLFRLKQQMGDIANSAMEMAFTVDFIYNSNKIEGSKIPREKVEKMLREGIGNKNDEVSNTSKALQAVRAMPRLNSKQVEKLHMILLAHEPQKFGFRQEQVVVGQSEVLSWHEVKKNLKELLAWYHANKDRLYPPELAFTFYFRFERIHPFIDGNGRMGRLLMNKILKDHRYHPMIIWNKRRVAHSKVFEHYQGGNGAPFYQFMAEQFIKTHEIYLDKINKAFDLERQMNYFMQPSEYNFD